MAHERGRSYEVGLDKRKANYMPLTPLAFLEHSALVYPDRSALIYENQCTTWSQAFARCRQLSSAFKKNGLGPGSTVSILAPNVPAMFEAHFAVPAAGAVLNAINIRLDAKTVAHILQHGGARAVLVDIEFVPLLRDALLLLESPDAPGEMPTEVPAPLPLVVIIQDAAMPGVKATAPGGPEGEVGAMAECWGAVDYETFLGSGDPDAPWPRVDDEWRAISLNYTSGTTADPKGVVYHHRGVYLNCLSVAVDLHLERNAAVLLSVPLFHCNGWIFPWLVALLSGTAVCMRKVTAANIFRLVSDHDVSFFGGAPVVLNMLVNAPPNEQRLFKRKPLVVVGGAPPPSAILAKMEDLGFKVAHSYGLTETMGPAVICTWKDEWDALPLQERATLKARQGVRYSTCVTDEIRVMDPGTMTSVPPDGRTHGEVMIRGNVVMKGYLGNARATEAAFEGGWFHTGDIGVLHPDGYVELKDRSKDIIISGGENISSIQVESILYKHPAVLEAAVVAKPDEKWGEVPCAFVTLKEEHKGRVTPEDIIVYCRREMPHYWCPRSVDFGDLPKTSTGKIQKFVLRQRALATRTTTKASKL